ncbi:MAG: SidA/IucD/PvdA family monooxygenase [Niabella sp.]
MATTKVFDLIGIGIGPFNLGLAALLQDHPGIEYLFLEQRECFNWHPGLLLPWARLQVPYFADLVTLANPQSPYTYINYLHTQKRLFRFSAHENIFPLRIEYNQYCRWVADQLPNLLFNHRCEKITYNPVKRYYTVEWRNPITHDKGMFHAKQLVIGIGTQPYIPGSIQIEKHSNVIHSSDYLLHKHALLASGNITLIGSGQSAAEIFYDLLQHESLLQSLNWCTRSRRIAPMDYSRFALEMASPDYVDYFYGLPEKAKAEILASQAYLYKGINQQLIEQIHDQLYIMDVQGSALKPNIYTSQELTAIKQTAKSLNLSFRHRDTDKQITQTTSSVILATGYHYNVPAFLESIRNRINWNQNGWFDVQKPYTVDKDQTIFVQNADLNSHGFNAADLGLAVHRNMVIINALLKQDYYTIEHGTVFQQFEPPV